MNKSTWAKVFGWVGSALVSVGGILAIHGSGNVKLAGSVAAGLGTLLVGGGIHQSSNTSAGHPNG